MNMANGAGGVHQDVKEPEGASNSLGSSSPPDELTERRVYQSMGDVVTASIQEFLDVFKSRLDAASPITREDFFPKFLSRANKLAEDCSQGVVRIIHASTRLSQVRGTSAPDLAKRVRGAAFKSLDGILSRYFGAAKNIQVIYDNIRKVRDGLEAAAGGQPPEALAGQTSDGSGEKWATEEELARQHRNLLQAQSQAFTQVVQYLKGVNDLPGAILNYACDKCFGGDVNYQIESEEVLACQSAIQKKLAVALETLAQAGVTAAKDVEEERRNILMRVEMHKTDLMLDKVWEEKLEAKRKRAQKIKRIVAVSLACLIALILILGVFIFCQQVIAK